MAFKSFDTKISSGIKWFKDLPSIYYAENANFDDMKNFILQAYNQKLPSTADPNFTGRFAETFKEILPTRGGVVLPKPLENKLIIDKVDVLERAIVYRYTIQGIWEKFFNTKAEFFVEYSENISSTPKNIAVIPMLCNFLPIAWVFNAEIIVDELDKDFYDNINKAKRGYVEMYPRINFGGKLTVKNLITNDYESSNESAAFFSGGVDSFNTLISHVKENPALITLWGSDIKLNDFDGWNKVKSHTLDTSEKFNCKNLFIRSSFRYVINEGELTREVIPMSGDGWWHGFQHGMAIIGHAAPYIYLHKISKLYVASSYTEKDKGNYTCASDPTIDNHIKIGSCVTIHDGYEFERQEKVRRICEYKRNSGIEINLRVCWESAGGGNCCHCEKCYRTILEILAEGENPAEMGFTEFPAMLDDMKSAFHNRQFINSISFNNMKFLKEIQNRFSQNPDNLNKFNLEWFMELDFSDKNLKRGGGIIYK